nr:MAG TPA: hypothetical protein [Caudoviricetes sp.]
MKIYLYNRKTDCKTVASSIFFSLWLLAFTF